MESNSYKNTKNPDNSIVHAHPVPPEQLSRYSTERDPYSEFDIASYLEDEAPDETVQHVERIKKEIILGDVYEIWDVTTDKDRWWVIANLTNLYSQQFFPSLDYTLSFHIGLMMRIKDQSNRVDVDDPTAFDEVFRRGDQAEKRHESAIEPEDFQAVGMLLRETLITLVNALKRYTEIPSDVEKPQNSNFISWSDLLINQLCQGKSNKGSPV